MTAHQALQAHASGDAMAMLADAIYTSSTGTNVCDFNIAYVPERA